MSTTPATDSRRALLARAREILSSNWTGTSTVPSRTLYPHQWGWDAAYIAIGWAWLEPEPAKTELESILRGQWSDGRVPHIVFDPEVPEDAYFPGPGFWRSEEVPAAPARVRTSGITQPPLHAFAALEIHRRAADLEFLARVYPSLVRQHEYLAQRRDVAGDGLAAIVHPWESGLDNSPMWDHSLAALDISHDSLPDYERADLRHVDAADRPSDEAYDRYVYLAARYRDGGYDDSDLGSSAPFLVEDPLFNAVVLASTRALACIARELGADPEPHERAAGRIHRGLLERLWDAELGRFTARDLARDERRTEFTVGALAPLLDPDLPEEVVSSLASLLQSRHVRGEQRTYAVPTYDLRAKDFDPRRYWRGPVWINTNWLVSRGLRHHGLDELADEVDRDSLELVCRSGFREYFDPYSGRGYGCDDFSWTAALVVDILSAR